MRTDVRLNEGKKFSLCLSLSFYREYGNLHGSPRSRRRTQSCQSNDAIGCFMVKVEHFHSLRPCSTSSTAEAFPTSRAPGSHEAKILAVLSAFCHEK
jgi:hypothetical protein